MSCNSHWPSEKAVTRFSQRHFTRTLWTVCGAWLLGLTLSGPVNASSPPLPPHVSHIQLPGSRLQGQATLTFFGLPIYHARLWTLPGFQPQPLREQTWVLELEYQRELKGQAIAERSLKEMQRTGELSSMQERGWLKTMQSLFPDVKKGDRLSGRYQPGQPTAFWLNDQAIGKVDDPEFGRRFFAIWLAPTTSEPGLRQRLLGLNTPP